MAGAADLADVLPAVADAAPPAALEDDDAAPVALEDGVVKTAAPLEATAEAGSPPAAAPPASGVLGSAPTFSSSTILISLLLFFLLAISVTSCVRSCKLYICDAKTREMAAEVSVISLMFRQQSFPEKQRRRLTLCFSRSQVSSSFSSR